MTTQNKKLVADGLSVLLADLHVLYIKNRNFHWNVKGKDFFTLHAEFEKFYNTLADDIDQIAERIRIIGFEAPGSMKSFLGLATLSEQEATNLASDLMVEEIVEDVDKLIQNIIKLSADIQSNASDEVTFGLLFMLVDKYEKFNWFFKSFLSK